MTSKLHKAKSKKSEGNKILGLRFGGTTDGKASDRKPGASAKHGHSKAETVIEAKEIVLRHADVPNDTTKMPETPVDLSKELPQSPPKETVRRWPPFWIF